MTTLSDLIARLIDSYTPTPKCPRCGLMQCEAYGMDCCDFARDGDAALKTREVVK